MLVPLGFEFFKFQSRYYIQHTSGSSAPFFQFMLFLICHILHSSMFCFVVDYQKVKNKLNWLVQQLRHASPWISHYRQEEHANCREYRGLLISRLTLRLHISLFKITLPHFPTSQSGSYKKNQVVPTACKQIKRKKG